MLEELISESGEMLWALAVFALAFPVEHFFGTGNRPPWSERLGNLGAMLVHFVVGSIILSVAIDHPWGTRLVAFPGDPRWEVFANPALYALAFVFLVDGFYYVYHRLQHAVPLLWHIHKLHHTDPAVNITTSKRTHLLERPLQFFLLVTPVFWILGYNDSGLIYAAIIGPFFLYFAHLDVRLPLGPLTPLFVGPQYHRIHHGLSMDQQLSNFAQAFPLFDMLGGTYHRPGKAEYGTTGIEGCDTARERWQPMIW